MFEKLDILDHELFLAINSNHSPYLDRFMVIISSKILWIVVLLLVGFIIYRNRKRIIDVIFYFLSVFTTMGITYIVKFFVLRPRPIHIEAWEGKIHAIGAYSEEHYSFFSSHASSSFAIAIFAFLILKTKRLYGIIAIIWAALVSYSRIYIGKHFPGDVMVGILVGSLVSYLCYLLLVKKGHSIESKLKKK